MVAAIRMRTATEEEERSMCWMYECSRQSVDGRKKERKSERDSQVTTGNSRASGFRQLSWHPGG